MKSNLFFSSVWQRLATSISLRILAVVGIIGMASLSTLGGLLIRAMEDNLLQQSDETIRTLADVASEGLQTIMLAGYSDIANQYAQNLKKVHELQEFRILNRFGVEAFQANTTNPLPVSDEIAQAIKQAVAQKNVQSLLIRDGATTNRLLLVPLLNREPCHACHGSDHEVRGLFLLSISLAGVEQQIGQARLAALLVVCAAVTLFLLLLGYILSRSVKQPLQAISMAIDETAKGNLTERIRHSGKDEIARIAGNINRLKEQMISNIRMINLQSGSITAFIKEVLQLRKAIGDDAVGIRSMAENVAAENQQLNEKISQMRLLLQQAEEQIAHLTAATGEVATSIQGSASNADRTSTNVDTVSAAAAQMMNNVKEVNIRLTQVGHAVVQVSESVQVMTTSFADIQGRCQKASEASREAHHYAQETFSAVSRLSLSATEIGNVVELINNIAEQTNILALNASIEAAGAGSFGTGFAVVANEVKELARQTADATQIITDKIKTIQQDTSGVTEDVKDISNIILRINTENGHILQAVDEQHHTVQDISSAMGNVSSATTTVNSHIDHLNNAARDVAHAAAQASQSTTEIANSSTRIADSAQRMAEQSTRSLAFIREVLTSSQHTEKSSAIVRSCIQETLSVVGKLQGTVNHFRALGDVASNISDALSAAQSTLDIGTERFDVRAVKESLLHLLGRLERSIYGHNPVTMAEIEQQCQICLLEQNLVSSCHAEEAYQKLQKTHQQIHRTCREIVARLGEINHEQEAIEAVRFFQELVNTLFEQLDLLYLGQTAAEQSTLLISWHPELSVAVPQLDNDHQRLIDMINALYSALKHNQGQAVLTTIIESLIDYSKTHFAREEQHMTRIGYPELAAHRQEHQAFIERVMQFMHKQQEDPFALSSAMLHYLRKWLLQHIQGSDKAYCRFQATGKG
ncbi:MAG: bacteriohemerythrin [Magnetococcales bacterium]|nr:bacteriohemerythrin [Magnetococcales bacterium]